MWTFLTEQWSRSGFHSVKKIHTSPACLGVKALQSCQVGCPYSWVVRVCHSDQDLSKSWRASKSHQWFKSYGPFTEGVDFAYWWSCIGKGLRLQPAQQACLIVIHTKKHTFSNILWYSLLEGLSKQLYKCSDVWALSRSESTFLWNSQFELNCHEIHFKNV